MTDNAAARLMKRAIYILYGIFAVVRALFAFRETPGLQLLLMLFFLGLFVSVILSVVYASRSWSRLHWRALFPLATCVVVFLAPAKLGCFARDTYFRRQIPRLDGAVQTYRSSGQWPGVSWSGYLVTPGKLQDNDMDVIFWWGGGFPVKHTVLIYHSSDDPKSHFKKSSWRSGYPLQDHWWVVKD
jgi:hypothetical protein